MTRTIRMKDIAGLKANTTTAPFVTTEPTKIGGVRGGGNGLPSPDGSLIFDSDFNSSPDWAVQHSGQRYRYDGDSANDGTSGIAAADNVPNNFTYYYTSEKWHPNGDKNGDNAVIGSNPVASINNEFGDHLSPTGKSLIIRDESYGTNGGWGADAVLMRDLGQSYSELWVEIWVKFQPDFIWQSQTETKGTTKLKFFRCRNWRPEHHLNRFSFSGPDARAASPVHIGDLMVEQLDTIDRKDLLRNIPLHKGYVDLDDYAAGNDYYDMGSYNNQDTVSIYQGGDTSLRWDQTIGDGQWHKINYYLKMDSSPGAADGVYEMWLDDILEQRQIDIPWRQSGDPGGIGWNEVSIGGNSNNVWTDEANQADEWYAVSSMKVWHGKPGG